MTAISRRQPAFDIEYDCRGTRVRKHFPNPKGGMSFYAKKFKEGKNPTIKKPLEERFEVLECVCHGFEDPQPGRERYIEKTHVEWFDTYDEAHAWIKKMGEDLEWNYLPFCCEVVEPVWFKVARQEANEYERRINDTDTNAPPF